MQSLKELVSRVRAWRLWRLLGRAPAAPPSATASFFSTARPILREVSARGVRVYSLCGCCGAHLAASATLCDSCARRRSPSSH